MRSISAGLAFLVLLAAGPPQGAKEGLGDAKKYRILLAVKRGSEREARFGQFLSKHFAKVDSISLEQLNSKTAEKYDVVIADWERRYAHGGFQEKKPKIRLDAEFSKPVIMIGIVGSELQRHTKIQWGGIDLQNEAHSLKKDHAIFKGPLEPKMEFTMVDTPAELRESIDGKNLPAQLETWKVQAGKVTKEIDYGMVVTPYGFEDSPDAESFGAGAGCRNPKAIALARQGNYFLWGFAGDPAQMTEAGRRVFVNVICYMKQFDGRRPLVTPATSPRDMVFHYIEWLRDADGDEEQAAAKRRFPDDVREKTRTDPDKLEAYYKEHRERLCPTGGNTSGFRADPELVELAIASNRHLDCMRPYAHNSWRHQIPGTCRRLRRSDEG